MICVLGTFLTVRDTRNRTYSCSLMQVGRILWALARDNATPFSGTFSIVNEKLSCPVPATLLCGRTHLFHNA